MASRFGPLWVLTLLTAANGCHEDPCSSQKPCHEEGLCAAQGNRCVAGSDENCRASANCRIHGRCTALGTCVARSDADCRASIICQSYGMCGLKNGECLAVDVADCQRSDSCKRGSKCSLVGDECIDPSFRPPGSRDDQKEGCPCGCDHSTEMAAELRAAPDASALSAIDDTLRTIAEREDAGYITEAMVEHRMRMLDLSSELQPSLAGRESGARGRGVALPALVESGAWSEGSSLRGRAELSAHGQTTEIVRGKEKLLRASFRVGLSLQNKTGAALTVAMPVIRGNVGMPISRWYELGSDGRAWDGVLAPGETKAINVIGYLSEPIEPGTVLDATVTIDAMTLSTHTIAAAHWASLPQ